jgi:hypothetical protein
VVYGGARWCMVVQGGVWRCIFVMCCSVEVSTFR